MSNSFHLLNDKKRDLSGIDLLFPSVTQFNSKSSTDDIQAEGLKSHNSVSYVTMSPRKDLIERGPWWTFFSAVTKVTLGGNWFGIGFELAGLACSGLSYYENLPKYGTYTCATVGLIGPIINVYTGKGDIENAWNLFNKGFNQDTLARDWELTYMNGYERKRNTPSSLKDWKEIFHEPMELLKRSNDTILHEVRDATELYYLNKISEGNLGYIFHDPADDYSIIPLHALIGAKPDNPLIMGISYNGTLINPGALM